MEDKDGQILLTPEARDMTDRELLVEIVTKMRTIESALGMFAERLESSPIGKMLIGKGK